MVKVAFIADILDKTYDGATRTMFQIINRIDTTQFEFIFFCGIGPGEDFPFQLHTFSTVPIPFQRRYRIVNILRDKRKFHNALKDCDPAIIHIASPSLLGRCAAQYAHKYNIPILSIYHTHFPSYIKYYSRNNPVINYFALLYIKRRLQTFYNLCDTVLVPTKSIKKSLKKCGVSEAKLKIWPRGIDTTLFSPKNRDELFIENLTQNAWTNVLFASRLVWEKNLMTLIGIYERAEELGLKINFIIAGDGAAKIKLKSKMPRAFFIGTQTHEQLAKYYASADFFIFPSVTETYGNVLLEAMASGLPCIAAASGASEDIISQGINGFLCRPNDPSDYIQKILLLQKIPTVRKLMVTEGLIYARKQQWNKLSHEYFKRLSKIAIRSAQINDDVAITTSPIPQPTFSTPAY